MLHLQALREWRGADVPVRVASRVVPVTVPTAVSTVVRVTAKQQKLKHDPAQLCARVFIKVQNNNRRETHSLVLFFKG